MVALAICLVAFTVLTASLSAQSVGTSTRAHAENSLPDSTSTATPLTERRSLEPVEVLALMSSILQRNGYRAGDGPVSDATSEAITIAQHRATARIRFSRVLVARTLRLALRNIQLEERYASRSCK
jgi:hypothetical protein